MKRARGQGGQLLVVNGGGSVAWTFRVADVDQISTIVGSREAALVELASPTDGLPPVSIAHTSHQLTPGGDGAPRARPPGPAA